MLASARARQHKLLQCGIGAIRDAGDKHNVGLTLAREAKEHIGKLSTSPYIDSPGAAIHHKGRYGSFMGEPIEDHETLELCVASRVIDGADRIKLLVSGIINFKAGQVTTPPQMSIEEVRAIAAEAKRFSKQTFAHASGAEGIENSIEGGVNTVEHGFFVTPDQLARMRDRQIAWVPTFAPVQLQIDRAKDLGWDDQVVTNLKNIIDAHRAMLVKAQKMGVTVIAGSDAGSCGVPHGVGFLAELAQMESAGMSSTNILNSATGVSAKTLNFPEKIGRLAEGFRARMIFTANDPLATVANLAKSKTILFDGQAVGCPDDLDTRGL
jgi:imidazolonepropionase-like amidohydrolase